MNRKQIDAFSDTIVECVKRTVEGPRIGGRFAELEKRLAALEAKPHVKFCGVWKAGQTYEPGDAATHQGGLWICKAQTTGEPSKDFGGWQLAAKRGQA